MSWGWLWFTIGTQPDCERILSIDNESLPQIFVLNLKQRIFWRYSKSFLMEDLLNFLNNIELEQHYVHVLEGSLKLARIYKYHLWDGEHEEISLEMDQNLHSGRSSKYNQQNNKNIDEL